MKSERQTQQENAGPRPFVYRYRCADGEGFEAIAATESGAFRVLNAERPGMNAAYLDARPALRHHYRIYAAPLLLALAVLAVACTGQVASAPAADPCADAALVCYDTCPVNEGPGATAADSCRASCNGTLSACHEHGPALPELTCERVGEDHGCASSGCWGVYACNRNPGPEMGTSCTATAEGVFTCRW